MNQLLNILKKIKNSIKVIYDPVKDDIENILKILEAYL